MSDKNPQELAAEFLNIWQKQMEGFTTNPDAANQMMQNAQKMQEMQKSYLDSMNNNKGDNVSTSDTTISQYGLPEFLELKRRLCNCEERISELESIIKKQG